MPEYTRYPSPQSLDAPASYVEFRTIHGRRIWLGAETEPGGVVAVHVAVKGGNERQSYQWSMSVRDAHTLAAALWAVVSDVAP